MSRQRLLTLILFFFVAMAFSVVTACGDDESGDDSDTTVTGDATDTTG